MHATIILKYYNYNYIIYIWIEKYFKPVQHGTDGGGFWKYIIDVLF